MLKSLFDWIMERRTDRLLAQVGEWIPASGPILDLGSGTGHFSSRLERDTGVQVVTADVSDMHVVGPRPVLIADGALPFESRTFSAALLFFMLAYPRNPVEILTEAARVTNGPIILVQSVYSSTLGYSWHRGREFLWTIVAFYVSQLIGYVPPDAKFSMRTRRFYNRGELEREVAAAGLRIAHQRERAVLPGGALVVAGWVLEPND